MCDGGSWSLLSWKLLKIPIFVGISILRATYPHTFLELLKVPVNKLLETCATLGLFLSSSLTK